MLAELPPLPFPQLPVSITGGRVPSRTFDWRGVATGAEPLVALVLLRDTEGPFWAKSGRPHIGLGIRLRLGWYDNAGLDVQVSFSVGGGWRRSRTLLTSPSV